MCFTTGIIGSYSQHPLHHQSLRAAKSSSSFHQPESSSLTKSNLKHLNTDTLTSNVNNKSFRKPQPFTPNIVPDPIYYNMSQSSTFFEPSWNTSSSTNLASHEHGRHHEPHGGHFNPTYQHSTPNLAASNPEMVDEVYNNRPPSVRSSYSNFHGTRPISTALTDSENVFVGLNAMSSNDLQPHGRSQPMSIPPSRQSASRESIRSMAFLNNGPPAYNLNYHTPPDSNSETTM